MHCQQAAEGTSVSLVLLARPPGASVEVDANQCAHKPSKASHLCCWGLALHAVGLTVACRVGDSGGKGF